MMQKKKTPNLIPLLILSAVLLLIGGDNGEDIIHYIMINWVNSYLLTVSQNLKLICLSIFFII